MKRNQSHKTIPSQGDHRTTLQLTLASEAGEFDRQSNTIRTAVDTAVHRNDDTTVVPLGTSRY